MKSLSSSREEWSNTVVDRQLFLAYAAHKEGVPSNSILAMRGREQAIFDIIFNWIIIEGVMEPQWSSCALWHLEGADVTE